jgi:hypothetical protein
MIMITPTPTMILPQIKSKRLPGLWKRKVNSNQQMMREIAAIGKVK